MKICGGCLAAWLSAFVNLPAAGAGPDSSSLADLSLEELGNIEITSVSRRPERLSAAAASIFVITHEDIRRSGATSLPEALRLAPNLQVAQTGAAQYAISSRGFNNANALANKLLVLIDGRTVYSPIYSGVFWEHQDVLLEDVERIEVISGPGGTLWGANAVNGVINVITRSAGATQGGLVSLGGGDGEAGGAFRYGFALGDRGHFRIYAKATDLDNTENFSGASLPDGWRSQQAGFRADWGQASRNFTIQGDAYTGRGDSRAVAGPVEVSGFNLLARWNEQFESGSDFQLQAYFDRSERKDQALFQGDADTYDIEFQNGIPLGRHKVLWGAGYREASDDVAMTRVPVAPGFTFVTNFVPRSRKLTWENVFVQDEIHLGATVKLTVGVKLESNDYTGWETLPSARLAWESSDNHLLWGAISRAVRAPARLDRDFFLSADVGVPPLVNIPIIDGGPDFESEIAEVAEIGYRAQPWTNFSYSITAFFSEYSKLRSGQPSPAAVIQNMMGGDVYGVEAWASYQATDSWRLSGGLVELRKDLGLDPGSTDPEGPRALGNDPEHQWMLRSTLNVTPNHDFDIMVRGVSDLPDPAVPDYTAVDMRLGWRPQGNVELSATIRNLFDPGHVEFGNPATASELGRSVYFKLLCHF
ncbi:MAG TPA: TonB-dependent receptor [Burkholderiales bacterium]